MKVFLSSLIGGYEVLRDAAASGAAALGHVVVRAEDFGAAPDSPQSACLGGVRSSDVVVLILGERYGFVQQSGLSATHEEYREARESRPVIVLIEGGVEPEPAQSAFIREVQGWERGHFTADFSSPEDLRDKVIRALHDYALANESAPLDEDELVERARGLVPPDRNRQGPEMVLVVAGGPRRATLRPAELEDPQLHKFLLAEALTGDDAVLSPGRGTDVSVRGDSVRLDQENGLASVDVCEDGALLLVRPAVEQGAWRATGITSIIEEEIHERLALMLRFSGRLLDHIDSVQRLTHVALVAAIQGAGYMPWRTREAQLQSPNAATMNMRTIDSIEVMVSPPVRRRAVLLHDTERLAEDFVVRLRREVQS